MDMDSDARGETGLAEMINLASRRLAAAIVVAGAAIGLGLYGQPSGPRYQAVATPAGFVRVNTSNGTAVSCEAGRCAIVLQQGRAYELTRQGWKKLGPPEPAAAPQPPAPAAAPPAPAPAAGATK